MKKWYQKTGFIILFLFLFFPVGLYLMWKHAEWNKIVKVVISVLLLFSFVNVITSQPVPDVSVNAESSTPVVETKVEEKVEPVEDEVIVEETTVVDEKDKQYGIDTDNKIYVTIMSSEEINNVLLESVALVETGEITELELYDLAKLAKGHQQTLYGNLSVIDDKRAKEYVDVSRNYIINAQMIADNLMKYLDKKEISYLSDAKQYIDDTQTYTFKVVAQRMTYLDEIGLTEDEISEILSPTEESN